MVCVWNIDSLHWNLQPIIVSTIQPPVVVSRLWPYRSALRCFTTHVETLYVVVVFDWRTLVFVDDQNLTLLCARAPAHIRWTWRVVFVHCDDGLVKFSQVVLPGQQPSTLISLERCLAIWFLRRCVFVHFGTVVPSRLALHRTILVPNLASRASARVILLGFALHGRKKRTRAALR
jgi:hypothetical protein